MTNEFIQKYEEDFKKAVEHYKSEIAKIRTGRANPAVIEGMLVEAYGVATPLKQLARQN